MLNYIYCIIALIIGLVISNIEFIDDREIKILSTVGSRIILFQYIREKF